MTPAAFLPNHCKRSQRERGFSLIEVMVTIAVIGVLAALTIPMTSRMNNSAEAAYAKRNAQQAASLSAAASAVGIIHVETSGVEDTLRVLAGGIKTPDGQSPALTFHLNITDQDITNTAPYLKITNRGTASFLEYQANPEGLVQP